MVFTEKLSMIIKFKKIIKKIPLINLVAKILNDRLFLRHEKKIFPGSKKYWEQRYREGSDSGEGSCGKLARFKADIINSFVKNNGIQSVIDFGCGDGYQLSLFSFPNYVGFDVSETAITLCRKRFKNDRTKTFVLYDLKSFENNNNSILFKADLVLSLDVIYHLVENDIFEFYMKYLFSSSDKFVIIYSDNIDTDQRYHEKHRQSSKWIETNLPEWKLINKIKNRFPNKSCANFFIYKSIK